MNDEILKCDRNCPALTLTPFDAVSSAIGCYVCQSLNGDNPFCEDPFNTTSVDYFQPDCKSGRKGRAGLFPADACVKVSGKYRKKALRTPKIIILAALVLSHTKHAVTVLLIPMCTLNCRTNNTVVHKEKVLLLNWSSYCSTLWCSSTSWLTL